MNTLFYCATTCCTLCIASGYFLNFVYMYFIMFMYFNDLHCTHVNCSHSCMRGPSDSCKLCLIFMYPCNILNAKFCFNVYVNEHATTIES